MKMVGPSGAGAFFRPLFKLHPATLIIVSFVSLIVLGSVLLSLPVATRTGHIGAIDALFTATSAVCVTGLVVADTGTYFTTFGQWVILLLIQAGGLGWMAVSVLLFHAIGSAVPFRHRMAVQELFAHTPRADILQVIKTIMVFTGLVEAAGAVFLFSGWSHTHPLGEALFLSVFHAVSGFCNAGFSLFSDSMVSYRGDWLLNLTMCALIILGGIGYPVAHDIYTNIRQRKQRRMRLTLQTKAVLITSAALIVLGTVLFWVLEQNHSLRGAGAGESVLISLFQSVNARTSGFNSVDMGNLHEATLAMIIGLMFFGASPGSCGGGVKTTTLAVLGAFIWARVRRRKNVELFRKTVPPETVSRSLSLIVVSVCLISSVLFLVLAANAVSGAPESGTAHSFVAYVFEAVSAFGTVGLSLGATPTLSDWDKCCIILLMLVGRVGVLTFAYVIAGGGTIEGARHAEENLMVG